MDVQTSEFVADEIPWKPTELATRVRPDRQAIERVAECLGSARRPIILAGSRVTESGQGDETIACDHLASLAEHLDATIDRYSDDATMTPHVNRPPHKLG